MGSTSLNAATFEGTVLGIFSKPVPASAVTSGVGTNVFRWGITVHGSPPSYLALTNNRKIAVELNTPFSLGTLFYFNGEGVYTATGVQMNIIVSLAMPIRVTKKFAETLSIISTPNNINDPIGSADSVVFPTTLPQTSFGVNGISYTLEILGFGNINDSGEVTTISKLQVQEGQIQSTEVLGRIRESKIVSLGDSIPAGYGLGPDDNIFSYPMLVASDWGDKRDYFGKNLAITGAVSGDCEKHCLLKCRNKAPGEQCFTNCFWGSPGQDITPCRSVIEDQLSEAVESLPRIVTLTVGADDINFDSCLTTWLGGDVLNNPNFNGCSPTDVDFQDKIDLLRHNLEIIFLSLGESQIFVTTYYNPFPGDTSALCKPFYMPLAAVLAYGKFLSRLLTLDEVKQAARQFQNSTSSFVSSVLAELNKTIREAAAPYPNVHLVSLDFAKHDFCKSASSAWAQGADIDAWFKYLIQGSRPTDNDIGTYTSKKAMPALCTNPSEAEIKQTVDVGFYPGLGPFHLRFAVNCLPHPTKAGQKAIKKAIVNEIKALKIK